MKASQERWLAALESGKYTQTRHTLQDHEGYCCLGVACAVSGFDCDLDHNGHLLGNLQVNQIPVRGQLCLTSDGLAALVRMNDRLKLPFAKIAANVRTHPDRFFYQEVTPLEPVI